MYTIQCIRVTRYTKCREKRWYMNVLKFDQEWNIYIDKWLRRLSALVEKHLDVDNCGGKSQWRLSCSTLPCFSFESCKFRKPASVLNWNLNSLFADDTQLIKRLTAESIVSGTYTFALNPLHKSAPLSSDFISDIALTGLRSYTSLVLNAFKVYICVLVDERKSFRCSMFSQPRIDSTALFTSTFNNMESVSSPGTSDF